LVEAQPGAVPVDYMSVATNGQFNIGLYGREFLTTHLKFWQSLDGIHKRRAVEIEMNRDGCGLKTLAGVTSNFFNGVKVGTGAQYPYGDIRVWGVRLPGADIHKFHGSGMAFRPKVT
jgi:hypothetical protein